MSCLTSNRWLKRDSLWKITFAGAIVSAKEINQKAALRVAPHQTSEILAKIRHRGPVSILECMILRLIRDSNGHIVH